MIRPEHCIKGARVRVLPGKHAEGLTCRYGVIQEHKPKLGGCLVRLDTPQTVDGGAAGKIVCDVWGWGYSELELIDASILPN